MFKDVPGRTDKAMHAVVVEDKVQYMLQIGVIELADGACSSPVVLAGQEGQPDRFCVDFRKVNGVTKADAFPIPRRTASIK